MVNLSDLDAYLEHLCAALKHADRETSLKDYCQALIYRSHARASRR
jgi:hypothetical protein